MRTWLTALLVILAALAFPGSSRADHLAFHCQDIPGGSSLIVGDSHTVFSGCGNAYPGIDVDAQAGRDSAYGYGTLDALLRARHTDVAFDLGTNDRPDPAAFRDNLRRVWTRIGLERELVLVTCYTLVGGCSAINAEIRDFAGNHPQRVVIVEWAREASQHPEWMLDGAHFTPAGYEARVAMVKAGLRA